MFMALSFFLIYSFFPFVNVQQADGAEYFGEIDVK